MSPVSKMSLMPIGTPCSGPIAPAVARGASSRASRLAQRVLAVEERPGLHRRLDLLDAREAAPDQLGGR